MVKKERETPREKYGEIKDEIKRDIKIERVRERKNTSTIFLIASAS